MNTQRTTYQPPVFTGHHEYVCQAGLIDGAHPDGKKALTMVRQQFYSELIRTFGVDLVLDKMAILHNEFFHPLDRDTQSWEDFATFPADQRLLYGFVLEGPVWLLQLIVSDPEDIFLETPEKVDQDNDPDFHNPHEGE